MLKKGDKIPKIILVNHEGKKIEINKLKKAIIYFYPKDNTPGCTKEACSFRDYNSEIRSNGWQIFGVSKDDAKSHESFAKKYDLNFPLLIDSQLEAAKAFGTFGEKSLYGKLFKGILRTTFAIDNGKVLHVWEKVKPAEHAKEVYEWIKDNS